MNVLVWLQRDLRIHDNPALVFAAGLGPVLPVFIVEPEVWAEPDMSARQWEFVADSLADLREAMASLGLPLVVRTGEAVEVLARLCRQYRISRIVNQTGANSRSVQGRDLRVAAWAEAQGIGWTRVAEPGPTVTELPAFNAIAGVEPGLIPTSRALKLAPDPCPHRQLGGRTRGLELMESFLARRGEAYHRFVASTPLAAERASSRLSPHLAWGTLSEGEVALATRARQAERPGGQWTRSLDRFQLQLARREQSWEPGVTSAQPAMDDPGLVEVWAKGETGLPFLDACMRYLRAGGWLPYPMRATVAVSACHLLGLDTQRAGVALARLFTDYDPKVHWHEIEALQRGAQPPAHSRPNPIRAALRLDPTGAFTRRWLPELAFLPDAFLQTPWKWPEARTILGKRYPEPVVAVTSPPAPSHVQTPARSPTPLAQLCLDL
ncbi:MAG: deoxyribodipyrimidine photo-lyase [Tabrizicola sp.]|nr:deoxyribodipyrimidine photo-lyase [Tabrizicola sp.]